MHILIYKSLYAVDIISTFTCSMYKDKYNTHIEGCAIDNSILTVIAQLVMEDPEDLFYLIETNSSIFYRYADDGITTIPKDYEENIQQFFNSYHEKFYFWTSLHSFKKTK